MEIESSDINKYNIREIGKYEFSYNLLRLRLGEDKYAEVRSNIQHFKFALPSWTVKEPAAIAVIQAITGSDISDADSLNVAVINPEQDLSDADLERLVSLLITGEITGVHFCPNNRAGERLVLSGFSHYVLFSLFNKLEEAGRHGMIERSRLLWMISANPELSDPIEDLLQSMEAVLIAYARALIVDRARLRAAVESKDMVMEKEILLEAFHTDVRSIVAEARVYNGGALKPIDFLRTINS